MVKIAKIIWKFLKIKRKKFILNEQNKSSIFKKSNELM